MNDAEKVPNRGSATSACSKCAGALDLVTVLSPVGEHPSYRIYRCVTCGFIEWIAEASRRR